MRTTFVLAALAAAQAAQAHDAPGLHPAHLHGWDLLGLVAAVAVGVLSTAGHGCVVLAYRHAHASMVAPFAYVQLIWAGALGFAVNPVLAGSAVPAPRLTRRLLVAFEFTAPDEQTLAESIMRQRVAA